MNPNWDERNQYAVFVHLKEYFLMRGRTKKAIENIQLSDPTGDAERKKSISRFS